MNILAIDDERLALSNIVTILGEILPESKITGYTKVSEALDYLSKNKVDVAFLDIEMGEWNGISLAKKCKDIAPDINIIFVTGYQEYSIEAFKIHASGYLLKPLRREDIKQELENLRYPVLLSVERKVRIQTFGNFEIFVDDKPLYCPILKCKECLAYLVDRKGVLVTNSELAAVLWENHTYDRRGQNNVHRLVSNLMSFLKEVGISDILLKYRNGLAINVERVDCDYYQFLRGEVSFINKFRGEYMSNYSWAEFTTGNLKDGKGAE